MEILNAVVFIGGFAIIGYGIIFIIASISKFFIAENIRSIMNSYDIRYTIDEVKNFRTEFMNNLQLMNMVEMFAWIESSEGNKILVKCLFHITAVDQNNLFGKYLSNKYNLPMIKIVQYFPRMVYSGNIPDYYIPMLITMAYGELSALKGGSKNA